MSTNQNFNVIIMEISCSNVLSFSSKREHVNKKKQRKNKKRIKNTNLADQLRELTFALEVLQHSKHRFIESV